MLPIAILPIMGLLLGIGGAIGANDKSASGQEVANFFKGMSEIIFANLPVLFGASVVVSFTNKNRIYSTFMFLIAYLIFLSIQSVFIHYEKVQFDVEGQLFEKEQFKDIFYIYKKDTDKYIVGKTLGITSLQTSIFGGIIVGAIVVFVMNRWSNIQLPYYLGFFSGIKIVPMILIPIATILGLTFLLVWPLIGMVIATIGKWAAKTPGGIDGLAYGILGRSLMPLGLHHIVIAIAWQTKLGGNLDKNEIIKVASELKVLDSAEIKEFLNAFKEGKTTIEGDHNIWNFVNGLKINRLPYNNTGGSLPVFEWMAKYMNVYAGRFIQDYPIYLGAVQGLGLAMILAAYPKNRKKVAAIVGSSMLVAFLTGITEPLEFSFLFVAPLFYYIFYVPLSGLAYMFMKLAGSHIGVGFARGFIDFIIFGIVPYQKGTQFYWAIIFALIFAVISFFAFYFFIKKFDWKTPGRTEDEITLITKSKYNELKKQDDFLNKLINAYGGIDNIKNVTACATRLRIEVKAPELVNNSIFKQLGASGFIQKGTSTQAIFGNKAAILASEINDLYFKK
ncbi:PTS transporter subunit EIIC [Mesomycoplasma neurolyticum]|uniref:EIICBA-Glc n=1 Tax=Mesomycoplasma neurolyticum TaxID=2120 RepID=A0A449A4H8_9BACT|nr:PTS transporter subunit EIIC [Mesomycoplasma neurolyticum]VEU59073.1 EIICBA-Glc [Mesomycoplasma neurolyticum]